MPWMCVIEDFKSEEIVWTFYENELQNTSKLEFIIGKSIMKKDIV